MRSRTLVLILAAGKGSRLKNDLPKPLVPVAGIPMIHRIINVFKEFTDFKICVVIGHRAKEIRQSVGEYVKYIYQKKQPEGKF